MRSEALSSRVPGTWALSPEDGPSWRVARLNVASLSGVPPWLVPRGAPNRDDEALANPERFASDAVAVTATVHEGTLSVEVRVRPSVITFSEVPGE